MKIAGTSFGTTSTRSLPLQQLSCSGSCTRISMPGSSIGSIMSTRSLLFPELSS
jgi:hypothetical protein